MKPCVSDQEKIEQLCTIFQCGVKVTKRRLKVKDVEYTFTTDGEIEKIVVSDGPYQTTYYG